MREARVSGIGTLASAPWGPFAKSHQQRESTGPPGTMNYAGRAWRISALVLVAALLGAAPICGSSDRSPAAESGGGTDSGPLDAPTEVKVQQIVRQFQNTNHTPGVLVGIWSPRGTFVSAIGVADLAAGTPLSTDMQFKIASQTKTFTANLILQLVGEGKMSLDHHISR